VHLLAYLTPYKYSSLPPSPSPKLFPNPLTISHPRSLSRTESALLLSLILLGSAKLFYNHQSIPCQLIVRIVFNMHPFALIASFVAATCLLAFPNAGNGKPSTSHKVPVLKMSNTYLPQLLAFASQRKVSPSPSVNSSVTWQLVKRPPSCR